MSNLKDRLLSILSALNSYQFLENREEFEKEIQSANVIELVVLTEALPELQEEHPEHREDLQELIEFIDKFSEGCEDLESCEDLEFPSFRNTRRKINEIEGNSMELEQRVALKVQYGRNSILNYAKILDKVSWVEKFVKMRTVHRWFINCITEYVEIVEYIDGDKPETQSVTEQQKTKNVPPQTDSAYRSLRTLRRTFNSHMKEWLSLWRGSPQGVRKPLSLAAVSLAFKLRLYSYFAAFKSCRQGPSDLDRAEPEGFSPSFLLRVFNSIIFQKGRPSCTQEKLSLLF